MPHPHSPSSSATNTAAATSDNGITRLAVYGTLRPGHPNHHHLASLPGTWSHGTVRGRLFPSGWGAALGYPGLVLDPAAPPVPVELFDSPALAAAWPRLDAFEGEGYRRVLTEVTLPGARFLRACIYVLASTPPATFSAPTAR